MDAIISTIWILATLGSMLLVRCFWRNPRADGGRSHQGAAGISKHAQYFIDVYRQSFSVGTFSTVLGLQDVQLVGINKNVSSFFFHIAGAFMFIAEEATMRVCSGGNV